MNSVHELIAFFCSKRMYHWKYLFEKGKTKIFLSRHVLPLAPYWWIITLNFYKGKIFNFYKGKTFNFYKGNHKLNHMSKLQDESVGWPGLSCALFFATGWGAHQVPHGGESAGFEKIDVDMIRIFHFPVWNFSFGALESLWIFSWNTLLLFSCRCGGS